MKPEFGKNVKISETAIIYDNVRIMDNTFIGPGVIIGEPLAGYYKDDNYKNPQTVIGPDSVIRSGTIIYAGSTIGECFSTGHNAVIREYSKFGRNCSFGTYSAADGYVEVGDNCRFHNNCFLASYTIIKNNVCFYPYAITLDSIHPPCQDCRKGPVIEDNAVICANAVILPKVKIGRNSVVGAGAIINKDVKDNLLVYGKNDVKTKHAREIKCKLTSEKYPYATQE